MELVGYRVAGYRTPVRDTPSHDPGRCHGPGSPPTQYLCLHPLGPSAEIIRHARLTEPEQLSVLALRVWALRLELPGDFPVLGYGNCQEQGISPQQLVGDDYAPTQALATTLRDAGWAGFILPSAALPGTQNLVLFGERVAIGYQDEPIDDWEVPASMTTSRGAPPQSLFHLVRRFGQPHAELEAHLSGEGYHFAEPGWMVEAGPA